MGTDGGRTALTIIGRPPSSARAERYRPRTGGRRLVLPPLSTLIRYAWAGPTTFLGLVLVLTGFRRARLRVVDGVLEAHGPALAWMLSHFLPLPGGAAALTLGHVVVARDSRCLRATRTHERVHVRQCELWGPFFIPAYLAASLWAFLAGRDFYLDNRFESEAFARTTAHR